MVLRKVKEASYLTAENYFRYRAILRFFYTQHERMREFIFPGEVFLSLKEVEGFSEYTEDQLQLDLNQLVEWGNLSPKQEIGSARTIDEYKKKRFRYQPTPYTIEFERLLMEMENKEESFGGALERTQFERLYRLIQDVEEVVFGQTKKQDEEVNQLWEDVQTYFKQIVQNTSDYIAYINSEAVEERMQTEAFLLYKDQFTKYLREFIRAMQSTSEQIKSVLAELPEGKLYPFFEQVWRHKAQARLEEVDVTNERRLLEEYTGRWQSMQQWFRGTQSYGKSEAEMLLDRTSESIRKITQVVQRMGERHQNFRSRREEYLYLANWFTQLENIEEAHKFFATAFGVEHTRHYYLQNTRSENLYEEEWSHTPQIHITKPGVRQYREKTKSGAVVDQTLKRKAAREEYLKEKANERKAIEQYIVNQSIELEKLEKVEPSVRHIFLSWIGKAMGQKDRTIQTDLGIRVKVLLKDERIILRSYDGDLEMPNVTFKIVEEKGKKGHGA